MGSRLRERASDDSDSCNLSDVLKIVFSYVQLNPSADLTIVDADSSYGGVWSKDRIYPELFNDSPRGLYEYPDMSMVDADHPVGGEMSGEEIHRYLTMYAARADLVRRTRFNTYVNHVRRKGPGWAVETSSGKLHCDKLIVASGKYSKPFVPEVPNEGFQGISFHTKSLGTRYHELTSDVVKTVVIVGGTKSATETATICLKAGKTVHWVLRTSGDGPAPIVIKPKDLRSYETLLLCLPRPARLVAPSPYDRSSIGYYLLHSGRHRRISGWLSTKLRQWVAVKPQMPNYTANENIAKLRPAIFHPLFRIKLPIVLPQDNVFLPAVDAGTRTKIHRASVSALKESSLILSTGEEIATNVIVWSTGWADTHSCVFSSPDALDLGLPIPLSSEPRSLASHWSNLDALADEEILQAFPFLSTAPPHPNPSPVTTTPYRLHRHMVPSTHIAQGDRSIAFVGACGAVNTVTYASICALWAVAWLEDLHPRHSLLSSARSPSTKGGKEREIVEMEKQIALTNAFLRRRTLGKGHLRPGHGLESQYVVDRLMGDLGLTVWRKSVRRNDAGWWEKTKTWITGILWREWMEVYRCAEYNGVVDELLDIARREGRGRFAKYG